MTVLARTVKPATNKRLLEAKASHAVSMWRGKVERANGAGGSPLPARFKTTRLRERPPTGGRRRLPVGGQRKVRSPRHETRPKQNVFNVRASWASSSIQSTDRLELVPRFGRRAEPCALS